MKKQEVMNALKQMRENSKQRKFAQTVEYIVNFTGIDFKKADKRIDFDVVLPHSTGKQQAAKVLVFVKDKNFASALKGKADVIMEPEIPNLKKKRISEIINTYDALFAEGPVMIPVGKYLGQQLAPKGKMPKPLTTNLAQFDDLVSKLNVGIKVTNKKGKFMPVVQIPVGTEKHNDSELAENIMAVYDALLPNLEKQTQNIKSMFVKLTMGPPIRLGDEK